MAPSAQAHGRHRNVLLFQKLLNLRENASPFTLVLDNLEQPADPIVNEFAFRAKRLSKARVIYLRCSTIKTCPQADIVVTTRGKRLDAVTKEVLSHYPPAANAPTKQKSPPRAVVILDSLNAIAALDWDLLWGFLSSIILPSVSLIAVYHTDVPVVLPRDYNEYAPPPLTLLTNFATAILRLSSFHHEVERQKARNRSLEEPNFGLGEGREGVLIGLQDKPRADAASGMVAEVEFRRRSGRTILDTYVVSFPADRDGQRVPAEFCLLKTHPAFVPPEDTAAGRDDEEQPESTFNLGLTDKQRKDREGVVLPYFDAQVDIGGGEGGRILYDMGREDQDDFDDEEDEI